MDYNPRTPPLLFHVVFSPNRNLFIYDFVTGLGVDRRKLYIRYLIALRVFYKIPNYLKIIVYFRKESLKINNNKPINAVKSRENTDDD